MSLERISDAELTIMEILWEQAPLTATDVAARLPGGGWWFDLSPARTAASAANPTVGVG